jgi:AraC family transcriptional regulator, melibiose operon regulatory protein
MTRPDRHNEIEINLLPEGTLTYLFGGRKLRIPARRLSMFWAAIPHQIVAFDNAPEYFVATLPLAWFLQSKLPDKLVQSLLQGEIVSEEVDADVAGDLALLARWEKDFQHLQGNLQRAVLLELEARLLRLAMLPALNEKRRSLPSRRAQTRTGMTKVEGIAAFIAHRYTQPITAQDIADSVGLHPNYAMSLFKKTFGTTLIDYVTKHRISHAQRLLATTDAKIVDIALSSGFVSTSGFNAAFRKECGCSPRQYRREHRMNSETDSD